MASKRLRRALSTGFETGSGILGAQIQAARDEEKRRRLANQENLASLLGLSLVEQRKAKKKKLEERKPEDTGRWKPLRNTGYLYNDLTGETKKAVDEIGELIREPEKEKRPTNILGAPSYNKLIGDREKKTYEAQAGYDKKYAELMGALAQELDQEYEGAATPEFQTEDKYGATFDVSKSPEMTVIMEALQYLGARPPDYQRPFGEGAKAVKDSAEIARQDPEYLEALMDFDPTATAKPNVFRRAWNRLSGRSGQPDAGTRDEQEIINQLKSVPRDQIIRWDLIAHDYPDLDVAKIKEALGR